jgi:hypothetical protein
MLRLGLLNEGLDGAELVVAHGEQSSIGLSNDRRAVGRAQPLGGVSPRMIS